MSAQQFKELVDQAAASPPSQAQAQACLQELLSGPQVLHLLEDFTRLQIYAQALLPELAQTLASRSDPSKLRAALKSLVASLDCEDKVPAQPLEHAVANLLQSSPAAAGLVWALPSPYAAQAIAAAPDLKLCLEDLHTYIDFLRKAPAGALTNEALAAVLEAFTGRQTELREQLLMEGLHFLLHLIEICERQTSLVGPVLDTVATVFGNYTDIFKEWAALPEANAEVNEGFSTLARHSISSPSVQFGVPQVLSGLSYLQLYFPVAAAVAELKPETSWELFEFSVRVGTSDLTRLSKPVQKVKRLRITEAAKALVDLLLNTPNGNSEVLQRFISVYTPEKQLQLIVALLEEYSADEPKRLLVDLFREIAQPCPALLEHVFSLQPVLDFVGVYEAALRLLVYMAPAEPAWVQEEYAQRVQPWAEESAKSLPATEAKVQSLLTQLEELKGSVT